VSNYIEVNKANWDSRVPHHIKGYDLDNFRNDPTFLSDVVRFDLPRLGNITGLDVVHLQCHIGTDSVSLARLGARSVTGLDFSPAAVQAARLLAIECDANVTYVESEVYGAVNALGVESFDLVFTGVGALCWLPDIRRWAEVIAQLLRPGGRLFLREYHPMLWALSDPRPDGLLTLEYPYFETEGIHFVETHSYVEHEEELTSPDFLHFNHGLGEIITALMSAGLNLTGLEEHDTVPSNPLGAAMEAIGGGEYRLHESPRRLAASYTLQAIRR
jgi:SAM-dependent methyltransferase